jgi:FtsP/CotA-like multicopper oxidase with cupredoxin domain
MSSRLRLLLACLATGVLVVPLGWMWWSSLMPDEYSVMDMGYVDLGGGADLVAAGSHGGHGGSAMGRNGIDISTLVAADGEPDVRHELVARAETIEPAGGHEISGYTLNGTSPGPTIRATEGDLVEVRLVNDGIRDGITLHWHGLDVPNAMDGVAGVTQDAVAAGGSFTYRFVADQVGTYWYHSHQVSHEQVRRGLFGTLVVAPRGGVTEDLDVEAVVHAYDGQQTVNGKTGDVHVESSPGDVARVRVVNTDNVPMTIWVSGTGYRVLAVDGMDVNEPGTVSGKAMILTAGGRIDLEVVVPGNGARVELGENALVLGPFDVEASAVPEEFVDLLSYGVPAEIGFDPGEPDRAFEYVIGRRPGFLDGRPGMWWTVNGHLWPDVPMYTVTEGDTVTMRIENDSGDVHPMHLHGHHAVVLSRDGEPATGSPWWVDSLNVQDGESYEIAFVADNPGVWMDHCHNLPHAAEGLVAHLMYRGYDTPFRVGGDAHNEPE